MRFLARLDRVGRLQRHLRQRPPRPHQVVLQRHAGRRGLRGSGLRHGGVQLQAVPCVVGLRQLDRVLGVVRTGNPHQDEGVPERRAWRHRLRGSRYGKSSLQQPGM